MSTPPPTVVVLTGQTDPEAESEAIASALAAAGRACEVLRLAPAGLFASISALADREGGAVALNLVRRLGGDQGGAALVPGLLALQRVPFVGSPAASLTCGVDRRVTKAILYAAGIPTPGGRVFRAAPKPDAVRDMAFPLVVKPVRERAGAAPSSPTFATGPDDLCEKVARVLEATGEPVLGEVYLEGRQFRMIVVGEGRTARALSAVELEVEPEAEPRFLLHTAQGRFKCPAEAGEHIKVALGTAAVASFRALECRDLAAVTLRLDSRGRAHVLGVEMLPDLSPGEEFARAVEASGDQWSDFLVRALDAAWHRR